MCCFDFDVRVFKSPRLNRLDPCPSLLSIHFALSPSDLGQLSNSGTYFAPSCVFPITMIFPSVVLIPPVIVAYLRMGYQLAPTTFGACTARRMRPPGRREDIPRPAASV